MNQVIPLKFIGIIAFIMVFTYTATGLLYEDYSNDAYSSDYILSGDVMSFEDWLDLQWSYAYRILVLGEEYNTILQEPFADSHVIGWIYADYGFHPDLFEIYFSGFDWFEHTDLLDQFPFDLKRESIRDDYQNYLDLVGFDDNGNSDSSMVDIISNFFLAIPSSIEKIYDVMSFNIPKIPSDLRLVLNIIFIPLWIILTIGIAPLIIKALQAVATFVDAVIPF